VTAVITAEREDIVIAEQTETAPTSVAAEPKATKTARVAKRGAHVAPKKGKSGKKASAAKKAPKTAAKPKGGARKKLPRRKECARATKLRRFSTCSSGRAA
jgi:hypothetical protein